MTDQERLDFDRLRTFMDEGRLIRGAWTGTDDAGRETACLLAALYPPTGKQKSEAACPASLMPPWLASLTIWINDSGTLAEWPGHIKRYAAAIGSVVGLGPEAMERLSRRIRVLIVREAASHITVDEWDCRAACDGVMAAIESGDQDKITAAESAAMSAWSAAESAAMSAESAARSAAMSAESAARSAAWSAARSAAWSAARSAVETGRFAAEDRMIEGMLTEMEEATRSEPGDRSERREG